MESGAEAKLLERHTGISVEDVLESITDVFAALDDDWRFTYLNAAAERLLRRPRKELLGHEIWAEYPILKGTPVETEGRRALAQGSPAVFEYQFGERWFEFRSFPGREGGVHYYVREVTEARRNTEVAERRLAELENIYQTAPIGLLFVDTQLRYVRINERLAAINGVSASEHIGRTIWEVVPEMAEAVAPKYLKVIETGEPIVDDEVSGITPAAPLEIRDYLASYYPVKDEHGKVLGVTAVVKDITEQKRGEAALRASETRFRGIYDSNIIGINFATADGRNVEANDEYLRITGYTREDLADGGVNWVDITPPEYAERDLEAVHEANSTGRVRPYRKEFIRKDGARIPVMVGGVTLPGQPVGAAFVVDLTALQAATQALRESEERYRSLVAATSSVVWTTDPEGKMAVPQPSWERFTGQTWPEYREWGGMHAIHPDDLDRIGAAWLQAVASRTPFEIEGRFWHAPSSEFRHMMSRGVPVLDANGTIREWVGTLTDIQERKRAEEELRLAAQRFAVALKSSSIAVFNQDRDLRYTWLWNEHPVRYQAAILGKTDLDIKDCEACRRLVEVKRHVLATGLGERHEFTLPLLGNEQVYDVTLEPLRDDRGEVVGITGAAVNITERKKTEQALAASEVRFRRIVETAAEGIMIQDAGGAITFANRRFAEMLGYRVEELLGKRSFDYLDPDDEHRGRLSFESRKYGDTLLRDFRFHRRDGASVWCTIAGSALRGDGGQFLGVLAMVTDITQRKQAEMALQESEAHMRMALDAGRMGIWDWDMVRGETHWNDRQFSCLGLQRGSCKPDFETWSARIHPEDLPRVKDELEHARKERTLYRSEHRVVWPDQSIHWIEARGQYFYDAQGKAVRMRGVMADITDRKQTEEALLHRQKLESVGLLAGGIAHDFNNLLAGILGGASYVRDILPETHPATPMLKVVEQASERAALLTRQLLAYSGRGRFVLEKLDLAALVRDTCELIRASIPKSVTLVNGTAPDVPPIIGDPGQMQQLIMNLLINAGEAIGEGNHGIVRVHTGFRDVSADEVQTQFRAYDITAGRYVVLEVTDNGCGMDQATLSRIFDPFFTTKFTGRGLGLAAAQGIVSGHRGAMEVRSAPARGTTFRILFPAASRELPVEPPGQAATESARHHGIVLVVDDEDIVRRTVTASLERAGFTVLQASSGVEAIQVFSERSREISLVVLDMSMPEMGGAEVLRELRAWRSKFPVLVYSGFSESEVSRKFEGLEVSGVLQKPFTSKQLTRRVEEILAN